MQCERHEADLGKTSKCLATYHRNLSRRSVFRHPSHLLTPKIISRLYIEHCNIYSYVTVPVHRVQVTKTCISEKRLFEDHYTRLQRTGIL